MNLPPSLSKEGVAEKKLREIPKGKRTMIVTREEISRVLHELPNIIPEMDSGERAILISGLGRAMVQAVGLTGSFVHIHNYNLYYVQLVPHHQRQVSVQGSKPASEEVAG